jgi:dipeptidyl aminopeptidase/acylaminoacyl peptidase
MNARSTALAVAALGLVVVHGTARAQTEAPPFELTVDAIMRGPELVGEPPRRVSWTDDGRWIYFTWKPGGRPWHEEPALYRVPAGGGEAERLSEAAGDSLGVFLATGDISRDERSRVVAYQGDLFLIDRRTLAVRRLTRTPAAETSPVFSRDGRTVFFVRDNNLFSLALAGGELRQLTDIRTGPAPQERQTAEGQRRTVEEQQLELFESIRLRAERREAQERRRRQAETRQPTPLYLDREERVMGIAVEPGGQYAILRVGKPERNARRTLVPDYVTLSGYTETLEVRAKVGDAQSEARIALMPLDGGEVRWLELAGALPEGERRSPTPTLASVSFLGWNEQGTLGLIGSVAYDYKSQSLHVVDAVTGAVTRIAHDTDEAWIGGPCSDWTGSACAGWLPDGRGAYFLSERDGFSHLYTIAADGTGLRQLTSGRWEVASARIAPGRDRFYLETGETTPFEQHFYHMPLGGGARTRITSGTGRFDASPSPDGRRLAIVHSTANHPPELFVADNRAGARLAQVTRSPTAAWRAHDWLEPEIVHVPARDGARVPARIYRPREVGATPNGAAVIFVHGAGYLQNVHNWWSSYYREYMFHHLLASRGYTVLDLDFRGSAGHGRDWRTAIYRHMGGKDLTDQVDGTRYLIEHEGVQPGRVGIYGGSYGGFITLMALFTEQEHFGAGAALRAVTDWAHYNHWYTRRILNQPHEDDEAYRRSSPIFLAEGLQAPLLIAHGMVDVNVHFQDVVRLAQRLIELGKTDWELAVYPVEDHGFVHPASWTDEYRRILELFERHLGNGTSITLEN